MEQIISLIKSQEEVYLIGVAGVPGSGKSTFASSLQSRLENSIIVPMDGYHLYRKDLDEEGLRRRGADFTFDKEKFLLDLQKLKENKEGYFSSFDHALKDPQEKAIFVEKKHKYVIVEGLYLFLEEWHLNGLFDLKIFMEIDLETAIKRVVLRHQKAGISKNEEEATERALNNDLVNGKFVLSRSNLKKTLFISQNYEVNPI